MEMSDGKSQRIGRRDGERMANGWRARQIFLTILKTGSERKKRESEREGEEGRFEETATQTRKSTPVANLAGVLAGLAARVYKSWQEQEGVGLPGCRLLGWMGRRERRGATVADQRRRAAGGQRGQEQQSDHTPKTRAAAAECTHASRCSRQSQCPYYAKMGVALPDRKACRSFFPRKQREDCKQGMGSKERRSDGWRACQTKLNGAHNFAPAQDGISGTGRHDC